VECKKKDSKLVDAESRINDLTAYIQKKNDRVLLNEKHKELEAEILQLRG
jgi:hypothetical protein